MPFALPGMTTTKRFASCTKNDAIEIAKVAILHCFGAARLGP